MASHLNPFEVTFPILLIAAIGYLARLFFRFPDNADLVLTRYIVYLAAPASLFLAVADSKISDLLNGPLIVATILGYAIVFGAIMLIHNRALNRPMSDSVFAGFTIAKFNLIIVGLPLILAVVGARGTPSLVINGFVSYLLLTPITLFLHGLSSRSSESVSAAKATLHVLLDTIKNPLILGPLFGLVFLLLGVKVPHVFHEPLDMLGKSIVPVGLVAVGLSIREISPSAWSLEVWLMVLAKAVAAPLIVLGLVLALRLDASSSVSLVLLFSTPTSAVAFALSKELDAYSKETGQIVVLGTILATVTIPATIYLCQIVWPM
ncbi:AEC family transporter [Roseibium sp. RKSG952]|uniref:AEC family transporter n=1 Tax=Roseibium sp. RKSG952 TaxID=2529384 RepID=UPI0012BCFB0E|nr:AEC family transporter [Roseibium sp. RKSG952]MTH95799.1 hypothetical protein [Roseibium sp. RKSG952]